MRRPRKAPTLNGTRPEGAVPERRRSGGRPPPRDGIDSPTTATATSKGTAVDGDRFDGLAKTFATRRQVVKTGAKVAYVAPVVAATFPLTASAARSCACASGSVEIPANHNALSGKCLGCQSGAIQAPRTVAQWRTACRGIGRAVRSVCPGTGNRIVLLEQTCANVSV